MDVVADSPRLSAHFANYMEMAPAVPARLWQVARWGVWLGTLGLMAMMLAMPGRMLPVFWGLIVPAVPLLLVVAPGLWRQVCPMAFMNQAPRAFGWSLGKTLPDRWQRASFGVAVAAFVTAVAMRAPWLNGSAGGVVAVLAGMMGFAFVGGLVFKGRSGWCGTFCPLGPIQRAYGHAPLAVVPNGYWPTCVGCQSHCYDFSPRAAIFKDLDPADPRHARWRQAFFGLLPGLILGFFLQGPSPAGGWLRYEAVLLGAAMLSLGSYAVLRTTLPVGRYRLALVYAVVALVAFYWFAGPGIVLRVSGLLDVRASDQLLLWAQGVGGLVGGMLLYSGLRSNLLHRAVLRRQEQVEARRQAAWQTIDLSSLKVTNRATGQCSTAQPGQRLNEVLKAQGTLLPKGCGAGVCGNDAVAICEGMANLPPPGAQELATLRRLGLEGKARLACVCEVTGPVTLDTRREALMVPSAEQGPDLLADQGIARVVVIGNGIAGVSTAEALRRVSPSVSLTVISDEPQPFYNRMALAEVLSDPASQAELHLRTEAWADEWRVDLQRNVQVQRIDREAAEVCLADGTTLPYDRLVLATGADAAWPSDAFAQARNTFVLRKLSDVEAIHDWVTRRSSGRALVLGGGVLGVEAALALAKWGLLVDVIELAPRLMAAQLDDEGARRLSADLAARGITVHAGVKGLQWLFDAAGEVRGAQLGDGRTLDADFYVACMGLRPRVALARDAGLALGARGIQVDEAQRTSDPSIYAVGDVAHRPGPAGLWSVATEQAQRAVDALQGLSSQAETLPATLKLKCEHLDVCVWGDTQPQADDEVWLAPADAATYWRLIWRQGQVVGWLCVGALGQAQALDKAVQAGSQAAVKEALNLVA